MDILLKPQKVHLNTSHLKTLNDFQKLLGDINWIRPTLRLTTHDLKPLFDILRGDPDPTSPRKITSEGIKALTLVEQALKKTHCIKIDITIPIQFIILSSPHPPEYYGEIDP